MLFTQGNTDYLPATSRRWLDMSKTKDQPLEMIMKTIATALIALSVLSGAATLANAAGGEEFGPRTTAGQQGSPN